MNKCLWYNPVFDSQKRNKVVQSPSIKALSHFFACVPGMAWVQLELNQPQVVTAKCSEPQAVDSDVMGEGSGVAILLSVRTETWWG